MATETTYYTIEFLVAGTDDLWLYSANDDLSRELTENEARIIRNRLNRLGFRYRVYLFTKVESKQLVEECSQHAIRTT